MYTQIEKCRLCGSRGLASIINLGMQSFTGVFPKSPSEQVPSGPLELSKCDECHLVQLAHSYDLSELYGSNYGYRSGLNRSMVNHLTQKVRRLANTYGLEPGNLLLDIGSNDCTLLKGYPPGPYEYVGVDPTGEKFRAFYPNHVRLIPDFFSPKAFKEVMGEKKAKFITSIAMFYDLESPLDFARGISEILADDGVWVFEQSYLPAMLDQVSYDTICHEHLEYYSLHQLKWITDRADLKIVDIEFNAANGGSICITAAKKGSRYEECSARIDTTLQSEIDRELFAMAPYQEFVREIQRHRSELISLVQAIKASGKTVFGYGASTKGNVILQYCNFTPEDIPYIAEVNEDKFGAFAPGSGIPIISEEKARALKPDYLFVLPWHFRNGIVEREQEFLSRGGQLIFPLPRIEFVSEAGSAFELSELRVSRRDDDSIKPTWES